jgi:hypothetical protein
MSILGHANRALGYSVLDNGDGRPQEFDTFTCGHCQRMKRIPHGKRAEDTVGRVCSCCQRVVCAKCKGEATCDVIEKKLERAEARDAARRGMGF